MAYSEKDFADLHTSLKGYPGRAELAALMQLMPEEQFAISILALEYTSDKAWWGDLLDKFIFEQMSISSKDEINHKTKLVALQPFYNNLLNACDDESFKNSLKENKIDFESIKKKTEYVLSILIGNIWNEVANTLRTEIALDQKMASFYKDYLHDKEIQKEKIEKSWSSLFYHSNPNQKREFMAQLVVTFAFLLPAEPEQKAIISEAMSPSHKIKLGLLIYILESINSPNSILYKLCYKTLHQHLNTLDNHTKLDYLARFKDYFNNVQLKEIEKFGQFHFADKSLLNEIYIQKLEIDAKLDLVIQSLSKLNDNVSHWWLAKKIAQFVALLASAPSYALGSLIGYSASETHAAIVPKIAISNGLTYVATNFLGYARVGFGYLFANFYVGTTLTRGFAKVLEQIGMIAGFATGGLIGIGVVLTYDGLQSICKLFFHLYENQPDAKRIPGIEPEVVKCLMNLPREFFSEEKRKELNEVVGEPAQAPGSGGGVAVYEEIPSPPRPR